MSERSPSGGSGSILFAGGGSGGHVSPGLAIAEQLDHASEASPDADRRWHACFACSDRPIDAAMLSQAGADFTPLPARPPASRPDRLLRFLLAFRASRRLVQRLCAERDVRAVVALGGFVAAPAAAAAQRAGIPVILVNLDAPPGRANRWIAGKADLVVSAVTVEEPSGFAHEVVGVPIRSCAIASAGMGESRRNLGLDPDRPTLLVTGASQGARTLNELVVALVQRHPDAFEHWQLLCLTGAADRDRIRAALQAAGVAARVDAFLDDMGQAWGAATLALSRAGANSVAEAQANRVPTVFLPYPWHHDRHQARNAEPLVAAGAALCIEDHVELDRNLADAGAELLSLLAEPQRVQDMREVLTAMPEPRAARRIAELVLARAR